MITFEQTIKYFAGREQYVSEVNDMHIDDITSPEKLHDLYVENTIDHMILLDISQNPNVAQNTLYGLANMMKSDIRYNNSGFETAADMILVNIANHPNATPQVMEALLTDLQSPLKQMIEDSIASNTYRSNAFYRDAIKSDCHNLKKVLATNQFTPVNIIKQLYKQDTQLRSTVLSNPSCPSRLLVKALRSNDENEFRNALMNPNLPSKYLYRALEGVYGEKAQLYAMSNPALEGMDMKNILTDIMKGEDPQHDSRLMALLKNPSLSRDELNKIIHTDKMMNSINAIDILNHPNCDYECIMGLAGSPKSSVRTVVARSSRLPLQAMQNLSSDQDSDVRAAVASNTQIVPSSILMRMASKEIEYLNEVGKTDEKMSEKEILGRKKVLEAIARNNYTPKECMEAIAQYSTENNAFGVAKALASNRAILQSQEATDKLVDMAVNNMNKTTSAHSLFTQLAINHSLNSFAVEKLIDCAEKVGLQNREAIGYLASARLNSRSAQQLIGIIENSPKFDRGDKSFLYCELAKNRTAPDEVLVALTVSPDSSVRTAAWGNPTTPEADSPKYDEILDDLKAKAETMQETEEQADEEINQAMDEYNVDSVAQSASLGDETITEEVGDSTEEFSIDD